MWTHMELIRSQPGTNRTLNPVNHSPAEQRVPPPKPLAPLGRAGLPWQQGQQVPVLPVYLQAHTTGVQHGCFTLLV